MTVETSPKIFVFFSEKYDIIEPIKTKGGDEVTARTFPDDEAVSEHTLVCLSSSPSNAKIIHSAAKMAKAYGGTFTALYVKTSDSDNMSEDDKKRLHNHIQLAEKLGADLARRLKGE